MAEDRVLISAEFDDRVSAATLAAEANVRRAFGGMNAATRTTESSTKALDAAFARAERSADAYAAAARRVTENNRRIAESAVQARASQGALGGLLSRQFSPTALGRAGAAALGLGGGLIAVTAAQRAFRELNQTIDQTAAAYLKFEAAAAKAAGGNTELAKSLSPILTKMKEIDKAIESNDVKIGATTSRWKLYGKAVEGAASEGLAIFLAKAQEINAEIERNPFLRLVFAGSQTTRRFLVGTPSQTLTGDSLSQFAGLGGRSGGGLFGGRKFNETSRFPGNMEEAIRIVTEGQLTLAKTQKELDDAMKKEVEAVKTRLGIFAGQIRGEPNLGQPQGIRRQFEDPRDIMAGIKLDDSVVRELEEQLGMIEAQFNDLSDSGKEYSGITKDQIRQSELYIDQIRALEDAMDRQIKQAAELGIAIPEDQLDAFNKLIAELSEKLEEANKEAKKAVEGAKKKSDAEVRAQEYIAIGARNLEQTIREVGDVTKLKLTDIKDAFIQTLADILAAAAAKEIGGAAGGPIGALIGTIVGSFLSSSSADADVESPRSLSSQSRATSTASGEDQIVRQSIIDVRHRITSESRPQLVVKRVLTPSPSSVERSSVGLYLDAVVDAEMLPRLAGV